MKKFKILSLILALTLVFASMTTVAFADGTEGGFVNIVADTAALNALTYSYTKVDTNQAIKELLPADNVDPSKTDVLKFSTESYNYETTIGNENAIKFSDSTDEGHSLGVYDWTKFDSLKIETDIYIGDVDDGFGFRFKRYAADTTEDYKENGTSLDFFVGVGGKSFSRGTVTNGYTYEVLALKPGWNTVVIEVGSSTKAVNITVNGETPSIKARKIVSGTSSPIDAKLPEGTYGFCGSTNKAVLIPKGKKAANNKLDVRLHDFKMSAVSEEEVVEVTGGSLDYTSNKTKTTGYVKYINTTSVDKPIVIVIANYDAKHNLIKADIFKETLPANTADQIRNNMPTATTGTVSYSKQFVWENIDGNIVPLYESMRKNY